MSRHSKDLNENISIHYGSSMPVGYFFDVTDQRYADSGFDEQGEGYVVEHWSNTGFDLNLIDITFEELDDDDTIIKKCDAYIAKLNGLDCEV